MLWSGSKQNEHLTPFSPKLFRLTQLTQRSFWWGLIQLTEFFSGGHIPVKTYYVFLLFSSCLFFQDLVKKIASERLDPVIPGSQSYYEQNAIFITTQRPKTLFQKAILRANKQYPYSLFPLNTVTGNVSDGGYSISQDFRGKRLSRTSANPWWACSIT